MGVVLEPLEIPWELGDDDYVQACNEREACVVAPHSRLEPVRFRAILQRHSRETFSALTLSRQLPARKTIRKIQREKRRSLSVRQQHEHARGVKQNILGSGLLNRCTTCAIYLPLDEELDTRPLVERLLTMGKSVSLPVIKPEYRLEFRVPDAHFDLVPNRYGIAEPDPATSRLRTLWTHSVIFMPLVAFDAHGNRIGMGGGYYDRALSNTSKRPLCIGLAHELQFTPDIPAEAWDVSMDAVITEKGCRAFSKTAAIALNTKLIR